MFIIIYLLLFHFITSAPNSIFHLSSRIPLLKLKDKNLKYIPRKIKEKSGVVSIRYLNKLTIDHRKKFKNIPLLDQGQLGACAHFAFYQLWQVQTGQKTSFTASFHDWWYNYRDAEDEIIDLIDEEKDILIFIRNNRLVENTISNRFIHPNKPINHFIDESADPNELLNMYRTIGSILYSNDEKEIGSWIKARERFEKIHNLREYLCKKHQNLDYLTDKLYQERIYLFEKSELNQMILTYRNGYYTNKNIKEREEVKDMSMHYRVILHLLPRGHNNDKLNIILECLQKGPIIGSIVLNNNYNKDENGNIPGHALLIIGYSSKDLIFYIRDTTTGYENESIIKKDILLNDLFSITELCKI